jgi:hypothetical protein
MQELKEQKIGNKRFVLQKATSGSLTLNTCLRLYILVYNVENCRSLQIMVLDIIAIIVFKRTVNWSRSFMEWSNHFG